MKRLNTENVNQTESNDDTEIDTYFHHGHSGAAQKQNGK